MSLKIFTLKKKATQQQKTKQKQEKNYKKKQNEKISRILVTFDPRRAIPIKRRIPLPITTSRWLGVCGPITELRRQRKLGAVKRGNTP